MLALSILPFPLFGFIAGVPEIYMTRFGMDERQVRLFFRLQRHCLLIRRLLFHPIVPAYFLQPP
jgi:hypothetical protein